LNENKNQNQKKVEKKQQKQQKQQKVDKKLVRKFNKDCLGQNKQIEINNDTEKLILFGLSQKENILKRDENNYEKIANLLIKVIFNEKNIKQKNKQKVIDLDKIYDIIYNKTNLAQSGPNEFLALILEILSLTEIERSCLFVTKYIDSKDLINKYLAKTPNIESKQTMKEFEEYGLQYIYPLNMEIINNLEQKINEKCSIKDIAKHLKDLKRENLIYSNYKTIHLILSYVLNTFYFNLCIDDEHKNEELAKSLIVSGGKEMEKTDFFEIIELLHCKNKDDEDKEDEEEDEDDEVDSHSLLILSNIISISSKMNNEYKGLLSLLKRMELNRLIHYKAIQNFVQCDSDKYTKNRLNALSKLTDWTNDLDAKQARIEMEKDNEIYEEEDGADNEYAGNLLAQRKHKTAADYEQNLLYVE